jgi:hypothetical protein
MTKPRAPKGNFVIPRSFVSMDNLRSELARLAGTTITRVGLLVWPAASAPDETDVRLYLDLASAGRECASVQLRTGADGQTPELEFGYIPGGIPIAALPGCRLAWGKDTFWTSHDSYSHELFVITPEASSELRVLCGQQILIVNLVCFADDVTATTGLCLECQNGLCVWSIPGSFGNVVTMNVPDNWWPDPIVLIPV